VVEGTAGCCSRANLRLLGACGCGCQRGAARSTSPPSSGRPDQATGESAAELSVGERERGLLLRLWSTRHRGASAALCSVRWFYRKSSNNLTGKGEGEERPGVSYVCGGNAGDIRTLTPVAGVEAWILPGSALSNCSFLTMRFQFSWSVIPRWRGNGRINFFLSYMGIKSSSFFSIPF
jgi:hypothetical protein